MNIDMMQRMHSVVPVRAAMQGSYRASPLPVLVHLAVALQPEGFKTGTGKPSTCIAIIMPSQTAVQWLTSVTDFWQIGECHPIEEFVWRTPKSFHKPARGPCPH